MPVPNLLPAIITAAEKAVIEILQVVISGARTSEGHIDPEHLTTALSELQSRHGR